MKLPLIMKLTLLLFALSLSACVTDHKVNIDAIEANKNKTFTIGIIKVTGNHPFIKGDTVVDKKIIVLQKVPIKEICDILFANYGINVNLYFNRTIKVVPDRYEGLNPYWGNKEYNEPGFLKRQFLKLYPTIIDEDIGDTVYIWYGFGVGGPPWALTGNFYYVIKVQSDAEVLMLHRGIVATVDISGKGLAWSPLSLEEYMLNEANSLVGTIPEALARDIKAMK